MGLGNVDDEFGELESISALTIDVASQWSRQEAFGRRKFIYVLQNAEITKMHNIFVGSNEFLKYFGMRELVSLSHAIVSNFGRGGK